MALIQIVERTLNFPSNNAVVSFDHRTEYPVSVQPPFATEHEHHEHELAWYSEQHLAHPFMGQKRAELAAASIKDYGEQLFTQVFRSNPDLYAAYKKHAEAGLSTLAFEIAGSPVFHALHWEALKDPNLPHPFVLDATMVRKHPKPVPFEASVRPSPTINVLVVTARPNGIRDVGYRTISRPLVETLRQANVPVQLDFVRPGTYVALEQHLNATTAQHGAGYYAVIHFDVHGAVLSYAELQQAREANRFLFQNRPGFDRPDLPPMQARKRFCFCKVTRWDRLTPSKRSLGRVTSRRAPITT